VTRCGGGKAYALPYAPEGVFYACTLSQARSTKKVKKVGVID